MLGGTVLSIQQPQRFRHPPGHLTRSFAMGSREDDSSWTSYPRDVRHVTFIAKCKLLLSIKSLI